MALEILKYKQIINKSRSTIDSCLVFIDTFDLKNNDNVNLHILITTKLKNKEKFLIFKDV